MNEKFKCVECGENEVDHEDDTCYDCWAEQEEDDDSEDEE